MSKKDALTVSTFHIPFMDTERDIFDSVCLIDYITIYKHVLLNQNKSPVYSIAIRSSVLTTMIPQTYIFPEFIYWLVSAFYPQKCFVMIKLGENVFQVSSLLIQQALCFPSPSSYTLFLEETLFSAFQDFSTSNYAQLTFFLMLAGKYLPMELTHFPFDTFVEEVRPILQILAKFFWKGGYKYYGQIHFRNV